MNWPILILFGIAIILLVAFLVKRNLKDKKQLEKKLNRDYKKFKEDGEDTITEEPIK